VGRLDLAPVALVARLQLAEDLPYLLFGLGRERLCGRVRAQHVGQGEHVPGGLQQRGGVVSHALRGDELVHGLVQVGGCQVIARRGRCTPGRLPRGRRGTKVLERSPGSGVGSGRSCS